MIDRLTLPQALERAAETVTGYRHLADDGEERAQSYSDLLDRARRIAGALCAAGLAPHDPVAIIVPESDRFLAAFLGASVGGLLPVPIYPPAQLARLDLYAQTTGPTLRAARARLIVTTAKLQPAIEGLRSESAALQAIVPLEALDGPPLEPHPAVLDDPALIQFTSGSTSEPKGVVLTHRSIAANIAAIGGPDGLAFDERDSGASWLPLFHDMGLIGMALSALYFRRPTTFLSPVAFLKRPIEWLRAISRYRATVSFAPSFAYDLCVRRVKDRDLDSLDLSCWRVAGCGAEPIRAETLEAFARRFETAGFRATSFAPSYGMAEHTLAITLAPPGRGPLVDTVRATGAAGRKVARPCSPDEPGATRLVGCGRPCAGHRIRIVDEDGREVGEREIGEILVTGPSLMRGYFGQEALTRAVVEEGWLRTGDLGYTADGELFVCGRKKDTIILNGRNYYPQDLEWIVAGLPGVRKGGVVAFSAEGANGGDCLVLMVESAGTAPLDALPAQIRRRIMDATGLFVARVVVVAGGTIGHTTSGKLQRARAREQYESGQLDGCLIDAI